VPAGSLAVRADDRGLSVLPGSTPGLLREEQWTHGAPCPGGGTSSIARGPKRERLSSSPNGAIRRCQARKPGRKSEPLSERPVTAATRWVARAAFADRQHLSVRGSSWVADVATVFFSRRSASSTARIPVPTGDAEGWSKEVT